MRSKISDFSETTENIYATDQTALAERIDQYVLLLWHY